MGLGVSCGALVLLVWDSCMFSNVVMFYVFLGVALPRCGDDVTGRRFQERRWESLADVLAEAAAVAEEEQKAARVAAAVELSATEAAAVAEEEQKAARVAAAVELSEATGSAEKKCEAEAARAVAPTAAAVTKNKDDADAVAKHEGGNVLVADAVESTPVVKCRLKALDGNPAVSFSVEDCLTCGDVKVKIAERYCIPADQQVLYVGVKKLEDDWLCKDYIGTGTFVKLSMQMCGGKPPSVGEEGWWTARPHLEVKTTDTPFTCTEKTRNLAIRKGLKEDGWHALDQRTILCWHEKDPKYYSTITRVRKELGAAAPPRKSFNKGFSPASVKRNDAKAKKEQTGIYAPGYFNRPEVVEGQSEAYRRRLFRDAKVGRCVGGSNQTKSGLYTCEYIGEIYALEYVALFNPQMRPLICCCELWDIYQKYGIECEHERDYGWMEDMWWCHEGSRAGSGGVAGRLKALGLGDFDNRTTWPGVGASEAEADMGRVMDLLCVPEEARDSFRDAVDKFKVTYLAKMPGRAAYTTNHAARPPWFSRTSCWLRLVMTLRNNMRPEDQVFPGRDEAYYNAATVRRSKPAPNGREWFAGPGPWCLVPVITRAALLRIDGRVLAPADFTGQQHTIVMMSLASLHNGRPMIIEVQWHREQFTGETATIVLAQYLIRLAQERPKFKYAIPEGNALKCAASLVNACAQQRARGMWVVLSDYLRKQGCLDVRQEGSEERQTWPWPLAGDGDETIDLPWCSVDWNHGEPHGLPDDVAEEDVHDAYRYDRYQEDRVSFINDARNIKTTYWALTDEEAKKPMQCFPNGNVTVFHRREPPYIERYKHLTVGTGLVVFSPAQLAGRDAPDPTVDDAVLLEAKDDYHDERPNLVARCWRHWEGNALRMSDDFEARVKEAVASARRKEDKDLLKTLVDHEADEIAAEDAAADEIESGPGGDDDDDPAGLDVVEDYSDEAPSPTDLEEDARVDCWYADAKERGWYPATVARTCGGNTYDIDYDDGDDASKVPAKFLRRRAARTSKLFFQGNFVMANWKGLGPVYEGLLWARNGDGFDVIYYTGEFEASVPVSRMRRVREADKMEVDDGRPDYSDPSTPLPAPGFEGMMLDELRAACRCRGLLSLEGRRTNPDRAECIEWLTEYLQQRDAS